MGGVVSVVYITEILPTVHLRLYRVTEERKVLPQGVLAVYRWEVIVKSKKFISLPVYSKDMGVLGYKLLFSHLRQHLP